MSAETNIVTDILIEMDLDEDLDEPIYCESHWCKALGKNPHLADWYWLAPCRKGTIAVCDHRRVFLVKQRTNYYCDPGCKGYHPARESDWMPIS